MVDRVVVDASVVLEWIESGESKQKTESILFYKSLKSGEILAYAPFFLLVEVANVLFWKKKEVLGIKEFLGRVKNSGISFVGEVSLPETVDRLLDLMVRHKITAYDAQYVYLAQKMGLQLLTFDEELLKIRELTVRSAIRQD